MWRPKSISLEIKFSEKKENKLVILAAFFIFLIKVMQNFSKIIY